VFKLVKLANVTTKNYLVTLRKNLYTHMPMAKIIAMPVNPVKTAMLDETPDAPLEPLLVLDPDPEVVFVLLDVEVEEDWPTTDEDCVVFTHTPLAGPAALATSLISAQLYKADPDWPEVTTWMLALVPSAMPLGRARVGRQKVPLPVTLRKLGVSEMLKLVTLSPRPRLMKTYVQA
jgi:hypothetical protein